MRGTNNVAQPARPGVIISKNIVTFIPSRITRIGSRNQKSEMQADSHWCCDMLGIPISRLDFL